MDPLLSLQRVRFPARDGSPLIEEATLDVYPGQQWSVVGREGSGKSVLLRLMAGVLSPQSGDVILDGKPLHQWSSLERVQRVGVVFAVPDPYFLTGRVGEEVALGAARPGLSAALLQERIEESLRWAGLPLSLQEETIMTLSSSQRYRVALAATLVCRPRLLLVDEPAALLCQQGEVALAETLSHLCRHLSMASVVVTSREQRGRCFADHHLELRQGRLLPANEQV